MKIQRNGKRILAILLSVIMTIGLLPMDVLAADEQQPSPNVWVEFDDRGGNASVLINEQSLESYQSYDLTAISGKTISMTSPQDRADETPLVEILIHNGDDSNPGTVYRSDGENANLTVTGSGTNWSFDVPEISTFAELRIWWSPFDAFSYDDRAEVQVRTNVCSGSGTGTISIDPAVQIKDSDTATTYGCKYNILASNAFGADGTEKLAIKITPSQGKELDFVYIGDTQYRVNPSGDRTGVDIDNSSDFTNNKDGSYTYLLANTIVHDNEDGTPFDRYNNVYIEANFVNVNNDSGSNDDSSDTNHYGNHSVFEISVRDDARGTVYYKVNSGTVYEVGSDSAVYPDSLKVDDVITVFAKANEGQKVEIVEARVGGESQTTMHTTDATYGEAYSYTVTDATKALEFFVEFRNNQNDNQGDGGNGDSADNLQNGIQVEVKGPDRGTVYYTIGSEDYSINNLNENVSSDQASPAIEFDKDTDVTFRVTPKDENTQFQVHIQCSDSNEKVTDALEEKYNANGFMSELEAGNSVTFTAKAGMNYRIQVSFGQESYPWYTVSWAGGNVSVENGTVLAERVYVPAQNGQPAKIYTIHENEVDTSNNVYSLYSTIGKQGGGEGNDSFSIYGLGFSQSDLFIKNDLEGIKIDFKFVPNYGYQLKNIYTNEEQKNSFLNSFETDNDNISTFKFSVTHPGENVHFCVYFEQVDDTIDVSKAANITGASIANGQNAVSSGNLSLEVKDATTANTVANAISTFDVTLDNIVSKGGENGNWTSNITEFNDPITVSLSLDKNEFTASDYKVVREHNGEYEQINSTYDAETGKLTFGTNKFSTYSIVHTGNHVDSNSDGKCDLCGRTFYTLASYLYTEDGSEVAGEIKGLRTIAEDEAVVLEAPIVAGYNFVGWFSYEDGVTKHTGDNLCTSRTYKFSAPANNLSLVAVYKSIGSASVKISGGTNYSINGSTKTTAVTDSYPLGSKITVVCNNADFEYWENSAGMVVSRSASYTFTVTGNESISAVLNTKLADKATVVFESYYGQVMARNQYGSGDSCSAPGVPYRNGYSALGWDYNNDGESTAADTFENALSTALASQDKLITIKPVYELINHSYTITVENGSGTGTYNQNAVVTVTADEPAVGKKFSHWVDGDGMILSYNKTYNFYAAKTLTVTAVYVDDNIVVEEKGTTEIVETTKDSGNQKLVFVSMSTVPEGCVIEKAGIIATNNATIGTSGNGFNASNATYVRGNAWTGSAYRFTWTKGSVANGETWYVRAYLVYTDKEGNTITIYGSMVSQTM